MQWVQTKHWNSSHGLSFATLHLDARKLLSTDLTLSELAKLNLSAHQLSEMGFTWDTFMAMGADVHTLKKLNLQFEDIKLLWKPSVGSVAKVRLL